MQSWVQRGCEKGVQRASEQSRTRQKILTLRAREPFPEFLNTPLARDVYTVNCDWLAGHFLTTHLSDHS